MTEITGKVSPALNERPGTRCAQGLVRAGRTANHGGPRREGRCGLSAQKACVLARVFNYRILRPFCHGLTRMHADWRLRSSPHAHNAPRR
ncbi:MAG TPA: hypothetical protein PLK10_13150, partial [Ottowia sp.]|nr:hypothetical protein [Ottowia sp.]